MDDCRVRTNSSCRNPHYRGGSYTFNVGQSNSNQPAAWLDWQQLQKNVMGCNDHTGGRSDILVWYPGLSNEYCQGNESLHDGPITLADEQAHWTAWNRNSQRTV
jgi:hypothetical protein